MEEEDERKDVVPPIVACYLPKGGVAKTSTVLGLAGVCFCPYLLDLWLRSLNRAGFPKAKGGAFTDGKLK